MAFARLELLHSRRRIGGDGKDEVVDLRYISPVVRIGRKANCRVLLVVDKAERSGSDRLAVEVLTLSGFSGNPRH
ncbi:hypothetical protein ASD00_31075 [Ensifer sp. Root31]|nr:hypothetical protein ASD00_31075 [Ensifer sp. Root31]